MGTDEDSNKDGLITKRAFPAMMAKLLETPMKHQLSHPDKEMTQEDEDKKITHLEKLLVENNPRKDEKMTLDEWVQFAMEKSSRNSHEYFISIMHYGCISIFMLDNFK